MSSMRQSLVLCLVTEYTSLLARMQNLSYVLHVQFLKPAVQAELEKLTSRGVLAEVDEPTDWVSQMSVAKKKSGSVRICIDPGPLNK